MEYNKAIPHIYITEYNKAIPHIYNGIFVF